LREREGTLPLKKEMWVLSLLLGSMKGDRQQREIWTPSGAKKKEERKGGGVLENPPLSSLPLLCRTGTKLRLDKKGTLNSSIVIGRKGTSEEREREKGISPRLVS
jgi:hypothetical protein